MNRRGFLGTLLGVPAAAMGFLGKRPKRPGTKIVRKERVRICVAIVNGDTILFRPRKMTYLCP